MKHVFPEVPDCCLALRLVTIILSLMLSIVSVYAAAPITPSGLNTQVSPPQTLPGGRTQYNITGGTRPGGGTNLFHSFGDFNVPTNNIANFLNDAGLPTSNILGRVTGGNASAIYGLIQTNGPGGFGNANLFLMNPAGFLFGPNATLNVGGMVAFTTADYLRFDGTQTLFNNASTPDTLSPLSTAPVAAFGFLGSNPAAIAIQGSTLTVAPGQSIALVGGNKGFFYTDPDTGITAPAPVPDGVTMAGGTLQAPGGKINIVSVAGPGEVTAMTGIPTTGMALGTITFGEGTTINSVGDASVENGSGGTVSIRAGELVALGTNILTSPLSDPTGHGGDVTIATTRSTTMTNSTIDSSSQSTIGGGGAVTISGSTLTLEDSTILTGVRGDPSAATPVTGAGGAVTLNGSDSTTLTRSLINTRTLFSNGDGGAVTVSSPVVTLEDTNVLTGVLGNGSTPIAASGGSVLLGGPETSSVSMTRSVIVTESFETSGNSGPINITGHDITIGGNGGQQTLVTSTHAGSGNPNAGNGEEILITGTNITFTDQAWVESVADSPGTFSQGGRVLIHGAQSILIDNGTVFTTTTVSEGNAGNIELSGRQVTIRGQSNIGSSTQAGGASGTITVTAAENIFIEAGSIITTNAEIGSLGPAGHIILNSQHLSITGASAVASQNFGDGGGGTVTVQGINGPAQSVFISDPGGIFTDTTTFNLDGSIIGTGSGGDIFVNARSVTLQNNAVLSAGTSGVGNAGNIIVRADSFNLQSGAHLTSSSNVRQIPFFEGEVILPPTGTAGTVTIEGLASPAQSILIDGAGSGIFSTTEGSGKGGNINLSANSVTLRNGANGAQVSSTSTGSGIAGDVTITAGNQFTMTNSKVTTEAKHSGGGVIKITTNPDGTVQLTDSTISASVLDGNGGGGSVNIDPQYVILQNSHITANAVDGPGGNIFITTNLLLPDANSTITASSQFGQQGTVTIQSPASPASGRINPLGQKPLIQTSLVSQRCAALAGGNFSSFTMAGRDSLPAEPGSWLSSPLALEIAPNGDASPSSYEAGIEDTSMLSLRRIAPSGFLTQGFAVIEGEGCRS